MTPGWKDWVAACSLAALAGVGAAAGHLRGHFEAAAAQSPATASVAHPPAAAVSATSPASSVRGALPPPEEGTAATGPAARRVQAAEQPTDNQAGPRAQPPAPSAVDRHRREGERRHRHQGGQGEQD